MGRDRLSGLLIVIYATSVRGIVFFCPKYGFSFVVLLNERNPIHPLMSEGTSINEIRQIFTKPFLIMNYPYSSYLLDAQRAKQQIARAFQPEGLFAPGTNRASPKRPYWMREDMGALGFTWTLMLLATFAATQTDQPALWLLIGPAPLAIGFAATALLRRRFNLCSYLRTLRQRRRVSGC